MAASKDMAVLKSRYRKAASTFDRLVRSWESELSKSEDELESIVRSLGFKLKGSSIFAYGAAWKIYDVTNLSPEVKHVLVNYLHGDNFGCPFKILQV